MPAKKTTHDDSMEYVVNDEGALVLRRDLDADNDVTIVPNDAEREA